MSTTLLTSLRELGCSEDQIASAKRLSDLGEAEELVRHLRLCRCDMMDELHRSQKKVDNIDYLIRQIKEGEIS